MPSNTCLALSVVVVAALASCEADTPKIDSRDPSAPPRPSAVSRSKVGPDCPRVREGGYQLALSPKASTRSGEVKASGPIPLYGKGGIYNPPSANKAIHLWLGTGLHRWPELLEQGGAPDKDPGKGIRYLGRESLADPDLCRFAARFDIPKVPIGRHQVVGLVFDGRGIHPYDDTTLEVTSPPECGKMNIASDDYGTEIRPSSGAPGTEVTFSGTTLRGEDGRWAPSDRLEAWWDTDVPSGGIRLVRVDDMNRCRFETTFTVPDVPPGRHKISVFAWDEDPQEGYGLFLPHHFIVKKE